MCAERHTDRKSTRLNSSHLRISYAVFCLNKNNFPAVVSVTALRDRPDPIIGDLLIGTDKHARKRAEEALLKAGSLQSAIFFFLIFRSPPSSALFPIPTLFL